MTTTLTHRQPNAQLLNAVGAVNLSTIARWVWNGIEPGSFLKAVLANDLYTAITRADEDNAARIRAIVILLHNYCPPTCYGDRDQIAKWSRNRPWEIDPDSMQERYGWLKEYAL